MTDPTTQWCVKLYNRNPFLLWFFLLLAVVSTAIVGGVVGHYLFGFLLQHFAPYQIAIGMVAITGVVAAELAARQIIKEADAKEDSEEE